MSYADDHILCCGRRRKPLWRRLRDFVAIFAVMLREAWRGPPR